MHTYFNTGYIEHFHCITNLKSTSYLMWCDFH